MGERVVLDELREEIFDSVRNVASFSSLRQVVTFPLTGVASASRVVRRRGG